MEKQVKQVMLRFNLEQYELLRAGAFSARLPVANFVKELALGRVPQVAPPILDSLSPAARQLLQICQNAVTNLRQIEAHAAAAGEPLSRLAGPDGLLPKLAAKFRDIGMQLKTAGQLIDQQIIDEILTAVAAPARRLNDELARELNMRKFPTPDVYRSVLQALQIALADHQNKDENHHG